MTTLAERCAQLRVYAERAMRSLPRAVAPEWYRAALVPRAAIAAFEAAPPASRAMRVSNADGERAKVYIYDYIDPWGVNAADFAAQLDAVTAGAIDLHINSPGGSVWDGSAMFQALVTHPAKVTVHVDGIAASAASFIAMAAAPGELLIGKPARMMIHDASGIVMGNAADMRSTAEVLDQISEDIAGLYADRAGGTASSWREAMQANAGFGTWYSSAQAIDAGLADRIDDGVAAPAQQPTPGPDKGDGAEPTGPEDARTQLVRAGARLFPREGAK